MSCTIKFRFFYIYLHSDSFATINFPFLCIFLWFFHFFHALEFHVNFLENDKKQRVQTKASESLEFACIVLVCINVRFWSIFGDSEESNDFRALGESQVGGRGRKILFVFVSLLNFLWGFDFHNNNKDEEKDEGERKWMEKSKHFLISSLHCTKCKMRNEKEKFFALLVRRSFLSAKIQISS